MITKTFAKVIADVDHLSKHLHSNGFPSAIVVQHECADPRLYVHHEAAQGDPTSFVLAYVDPDYLEAVSNKPLSINGVPEALADGVDKHQVTIRRMDGATRLPKGSGSQTLKFVGHFPLTIAPLPAALVNGQVVVEFGPASMVGEWDFQISDVAGVLLPTTFHVGFSL